MTMMDERVAARRRGVSEDRARRRLKILLTALAVILVAIVGAWLVRSPLLSISAVEVTGAAQSNPAAAVQSLGFGVGTPTMDVRGDALRTAIEADPWVESATVSVGWPGSLAISVTEHTPLVPALDRGSWVMLSTTGAVLSQATAPQPGEAAIAIDLGGVTIGNYTTDPMVLGAAEFIEALPEDLASRVVLNTVDGSLMARLGDHDIRLGRPTEMFQKATVLVAMLEQDLTPDAMIDLIAPSRPAVSNPQPLEEVEE